MTGHIGARIRMWRTIRGMTQAELAGLAGMTQSGLSRIESGDRPFDRKTWHTAFAAALKISVTQLLGTTTDEAGHRDPLLERALVHVPTLRATLVALAADDLHPPQRTPEQLAVDVAALTELRNAADYASLLPRLPQVLNDLAAHGPDLTPLYVQAQFAARYTLRSCGYPDLARQAADLGLRAAQAFGDPAWTGQAEYSWVQAFPPESADLGARLVMRAADTLQSHTGGDSLQVYGCLHILAAHQHASAGRADDAWAHLREAGDVAARLGEPARTGLLSAGFNGNWFSPTQVQVWAMAIAAETGDLSAAVRVHDSVDLATLPLPNRHVYFWTDYARARATEGTPEGDRIALQALAKAERAAPQHFRLNVVARDLVATLLMRAQRGSNDPLFALARAMGIWPLGHPASV